MNKKYVWKVGSRASGIDAQTLGEELGRIHEQHGALRPVDVVNEARPEDAALHPAFEWNNQKAAEEWRVHTARNLIRSVHVVNETKEPSVVYVNVPNNQGSREYQPIETVVNKPDLYGMAIHEAQQRINSAQKALEQLQNCAQESDADPTKIAAIAIAMKALATASSAVQNLH